MHMVCGILELASWNLRTLVDVEGSVETARHGCEVSVMDERKIDQVVSELDRYCVFCGWITGDQVVCK